MRVDEHSPHARTRPASGRRPLVGVALGALLLVCGGATAARALDPSRRITQYGVRTWGPETGLPQKDVLAVAQTPDGYLWLGTMEGLVRFDGVRFTLFDKENTPGLKQNYIWTLLVDRHGTLWVGTYGGGLGRFQEGRFTAYTTEHGLAGDMVRALGPSRSGGLWIGTNSGLSRFQDGRFVTYSTRDGLSSDNVRALHEDRAGILWVGTTSGLDRFEDGRFRPFPTVDAQGRPDVRPVYAIQEGRDGSLWLGTHGGGLNRLKDGRLRAFTRRHGLVSDAVISLHEDRHGSLWVGTSGGLARQIPEGRFEAYTVRDGLPNASVYALFEDDEGSLWIGTTGVRGLTRFGEAKFLTYGPPEGLPNERTWSIHEGRDGSVWIAAGGGVLARYRDGRFEAYRHWPTQLVLRAVLETSDGSVWVGTEGGGLSRLRHDRVVAQYTTRDGLPNDTVWALAEDGDGALWVGTEGGGAARFRHGRFSVLGKEDGLPSDVVRAVYRARDGTIWLGTNGGLVHVRDGALDVYDAARGLSSDLVRSIHEDDQGVLWVGTLGGGLNRLEDGRITRYGPADGLRDDVVWSLLEDGHGDLWMSGIKGLSRVALRRLNDFAEGRIASLDAEAYDVSDGLRGGGSSGGSYPAGCRARDGRLWFPTVQGVVVVEPDRVRRSERVPPVHVEEVEADGVLLERRRGAAAPPGRGALEFRYTAPSFVAPERIAFRYRLEGFDPDWVEVGPRRTAYYTNVPPGRYRFSVATRSDTGVWSRTPASVEVELRPHFYQTRWFQGLCLVAVAAAVAGLHGLRVHHLRAAERKLARRVEESLAQIKVLRGLLPICAACKNVRDDHGYWSEIESYLAQHSEAAFSHGICPDCLKRLYPEYAPLVLRAARKDRGAG